MPRPSKHKIGNKSGNLEILKIIPNNIPGKHVSLECKCHACGRNHILKNGNLFEKMKSCGCQQRDSTKWKRKGAINRPWQLPSGESARKNVYRGYMQSAKKRNIKFDLTEEQFSEIIIKNCIYCGDALTNIKKGQGKTSGDFLYNGIDRVDNAIGYTTDNSVPCCWKCNNMKWKFSKKDFLEHIKKIYEKNNKKEEE